MKIEKIVRYLPPQVYTNDDLAKIMDTSDEWIEKRTGIKERRWSDVSIEDMTAMCLDQYDNQVKLDGIIATSMSTINNAPSLSAQVAKYLNQTDTMCIDLNAACSGFVYGLQVANGLLLTGMKNVLIVASEKMTNIIDKTERGTAILFGDGVCAVLVTASEKESITNFYAKTLGENQSLVKKANGYLEMDGPAVFKFATNALYDCLKTTIAQGVDLKTIDYFVFHQANKRIINNVVRKYQLDASKVTINIEKFANTSSASVPLALSEIDLKHGDKVLMIGFGAGLSYGSLLYTHEGEK